MPLAYRQDFEIVRFPRGQPLPPLTGDLLLHHEGESLETLAPKILGERRANLKMSSIDSVWKRLPMILQWIEKPWPTLARIPDGFVTAYPRRNKQNLDPEGGLATIEALFIAAAFLGHWDESLLKEYHFGPTFLTDNRATFERYGVRPSA